MPFGPTITKKIRNMLKRMLFCAIALLGLVSCGGKKTDEGGETPVQEAAWVQLAPEELDFNPFQTIGKDWMALAMGKGEKLNSMTISWGSAGVEQAGVHCVRVQGQVFQGPHGREPLFHGDGFPAEQP